MPEHKEVLKTMTKKQCGCAKGTQETTKRAAHGQSWTNFYFFLFLFFCFLGLHPWDMEAPRLGVELELQLLAYATATATQDPSHVCDLHRCSRQHWILNPLNKARDQTHNLMVTSQICFHFATMGTLKLEEFEQQNK